MALLDALQELLPSLPRNVVLDLLHLGVCLRCVLRFLNTRSLLSEESFPAPATLFAELSSTKETVPGEQDANCAREGCNCLICLGTLQDLDNEGGESEHQGLRAFGEGNDVPQTALACVLEAVRQGGHKFDSFGLEVSLPAVILVRERGLWCYLKEKYRGNAFFNGQDVNENIISLKEVVKRSLIQRLEKSLSAKFDANSAIRIAVVYKNAGSVADMEFLAASAGSDAKRSEAKRRRQGPSDDKHSEGFTNVGMSPEAGELIGSVQRALASMNNDLFMRRFKCPPAKVEVPCQITAACCRNPVYVGGRYLKLSRNISQSRWIIDDERMGDGSVQEIIGDVVFPYHQADSYKFHAAGREDIDVRMLGNGRPFILEISNARVLPSVSDLTEAQAKVNDLKEGWVKVKGLRPVGNEVCALMREGETEKEKEYAAVVWLSRPVTDEDLECLSDLKQLELQQKTPIRVLHRRSPLTRVRIIKWMRCEKIDSSENYFLLHLCTQAGTYIKEFVHGDMGRTHPNVGSLLGCTANILQLDVTDVKMEFD